MKRALALAIIPILMPSPASAQRRLTPVDSWFGGASAEGRGGDVSVRLTVAPDGSVARCDVRYSTASTELQARTCAMIRTQARYAVGNGLEPGQDDVAVTWSGTPLRATVSFDHGGAVLTSTQGLVSDLDYNADVARLGEARLPLRYTIGTDGRIAACSAAQTSGSAAVDAYTCRLIASRARFRMPLDEAGRPFATEGRMTVVWRRPR